MIWIRPKVVALAKLKTTPLKSNSSSKWLHSGPEREAPPESDQRSESLQNHHEHLLQMPPAHFPREAFSPCPTCRKQISGGGVGGGVLPILPTELEEVDPSGGRWSGLRRWIYGPGEIRNPARRRSTCSPPPLSYRKWKGWTSRSN